MDWKDEDVNAAHKAALDADTTDEVCITDASVRAIMTRAVELAAARAGTDLGPLEAAIISATRGPADADLRRAWMSALHALGARNAVLEAEVENLRTLVILHEDLSKQIRDAWEATGVAGTVKGMTTLADVVGVTKADLREALAEARNLRERLSAAEEGNRDLTRRAQQAEAGRDAAVALAARRLKDRMDLASDVEQLKARCATLSAAGQVLSAHVDKIAEDVLSDPHGNAGCRYVDCCRDAVTEVIRRLGGVPKDEHRAVDAERNEAAVSLERIRVRAASDEAINNPEEFRYWASKRIDYPCSPTCTHDDAAKPGHQERVKERSEAVTISLNSASHRQVNSNGKCRHNEGWAACSICDGYEDGAEAMRAACLAAATEWAMERGFSVPELKSLKTAIEGTVP